MNSLNTTDPHFVRCILPNEQKQSGTIDAKLVLQQLHCNGVLEGIKICSKGYPSKISHSVFLHRYSLLAPNTANEVTDTDESRQTKCQAIMDAIQFDDSLYRIGASKVLLKNGYINRLEDLRENALEGKILFIQCHLRRFLAQRSFRNVYVRVLGLSVLQRNLKIYLENKSWSWWKLLMNIIPIIELRRQEERKRAEEEAERERREMEETLKRLDNERRAALVDDLEANYFKLEAEKKGLLDEISTMSKHIVTSQKLCQNLSLQKVELESQVEDVQDCLLSEKSKSKLIF